MLRNKIVKCIMCFLMIAVISFNYVWYAPQRQAEAIAIPSPQILYTLASLLITAGITFANTGDMEKTAQGLYNAFDDSNKQALVTMVATGVLIKQVGKYAFKMKIPDTVHNSVKSYVKQNFVAGQNSYDYYSANKIKTNLNMGLFPFYLNTTTQMKTLDFNSITTNGAFSFYIVSYPNVYSTSSVIYKYSGDGIKYLDGTQEYYKLSQDFYKWSGSAWVYQNNIVLQIGKTGSTGLNGYAYTKVYFKNYSTYSVFAKTSQSGGGEELSYNYLSYKMLNGFDVTGYMNEDPTIYGSIDNYDWKNTSSQDRSISFVPSVTTAGKLNYDDAGLPISASTTSALVGVTPANVIATDLTGEVVETENPPIDPPTTQPADLPDLSIPQIIFTKKFPFCLPYDIYNVFAQLVVPAEPPIFELELPFSKFGLHDEALTIDFAQYDELATITRWGLSVIFIIGLILVTRKLIGAE